MSTYRCPNCKRVFSQEEMDAVFCPYCPTTLCECVMKKDREDGRSFFSPRAEEWIRTLFCCGVLTWIFVRLLLPFWMSVPEPDAVGLLLLGPVWCGVSAPLFRLLARGEYSVRTGILGAGMWLFTFLFVLVVTLASYSDRVTAAGLFQWKTVFAFVPGGYIAYRLGAEEGWIRSLFSARKEFKSLR